jgi:1-acyl-sn-glycerol-3-phosphate acyltransferase
MKKTPEVELQHPFLRGVVMPFLRLVTIPLMFLLGPLRVSGRRNVPRKGGALILANHLADIDPPILQAACPRPVYFMAKSELFEMRVVGWLIRQFKAFPVKRGEADRDAIKKAAAYIQAGELVCVFPEGQLSETGELQPLKPGVALIVRMAGAPVLCCGLQGTNRMLPYGQTIPRPALRKVTAKWGEPRTFEKDAKAEEILAWAEAELRRLTDQ